LEVTARKATTGLAIHNKLSKKKIRDSLTESVKCQISVVYFLDDYVRSRRDATVCFL